MGLIDKTLFKDEEEEVREAAASFASGLPRVNSKVQLLKHILDIKHIKGIFFMYNTLYICRRAPGQSSRRRDLQSLWSSGLSIISNRLAKLSDFFFF